MTKYEIGEQKLFAYNFYFILRKILNAHFLLEFIWTKQEKYYKDNHMNVMRKTK